MVVEGHKTAMRLLAVGDIGSSTAYHVGDESMMAGLLAGVAEAGVHAEWTLLSIQPARSSTQFGVPAVPAFDFRDCAGPAEREQRLAELDVILAEPPARWPAVAPPRWRQTLAAIAGSDAVIIAGGGNLCRSWPELVFERAAVVRAARSAGRPVATTGQTIGPAFDARTRELITEILAACVFVGVREDHSFGVALELGVPLARLAQQFDDAIGLEAREPGGAFEMIGDGPFIAVTLNQLGEVSDPMRIVPALAAQLVALGERAAARVVFVPHVGDAQGVPAHDVAMARAIIDAAADATGLRLAPLPSPAEAIWYARQAQLVVSTRYHPVVYAVGAATPALFLYQDRYTLVKGQGCLALAGLQGWVVSVGQAASGLLEPAAAELWSRRGEVRSHLDRLAPNIAASRRRHVAALLAALLPARGPAVSAGLLPRHFGPAPNGHWIERAHDGLADAGIHAAAEATRRQLTLLERRAVTAEQWAGILSEEVTRKDADLAMMHAALEDSAARNRADPGADAATDTDGGARTPRPNRNR